MHKHGGEKVNARNNVRNFIGKVRNNTWLMFANILRNARYYLLHIVFAIFVNVGKYSKYRA